MTRLSKLPLDQWNAGLRQAYQADQATPLQLGLMRIMAHSPVLAKALASYGAALFQKHTLPRRLIELRRLRVAFHNRCRSCMKDRRSPRS